MKTDLRKTYTSANKAAWNASAPLHGSGEQWNLLLEKASKPGFNLLDEHLTATLKRLDPRGKTAVQIGCNNARELLSLASLGIRPELGIDQSGEFLAQARQLAAAADLAPRFLEADIYDLPEDVGSYDLALITIGVLNWMPDLIGFFRIVADLLTPSGALVIYETHPFLEMFDPDSKTPYEPAFSYFDRRPQPVSDAISYDGKNHGKGETGYWFIHSLGEIVSAAAASGLQIIELKEYGHSIREPEYDLYENREAQVPMTYCLITAKGQMPRTD
jgi:SAM-dependent methyltransferase